VQGVVAAKGRPKGKLRDFHKKEKTRM